MIKDIKKINTLISKAQSESIYLSSNKRHFQQIESLSLQIHDKYLTASIDQREIEKNILILQLSLEENSNKLRYYGDALIRLLSPQDFSLTLVYKSQGVIPYIKGRVYWDNKQREVQIGSIPNVISQIRGLCKDGLISPIKGIEKSNLKWEDIKSNTEIQSAVKYVGKIKFKHYLLNHFRFPKENAGSGKLLKAHFSTPKEVSNANDPKPVENILEAKDWYSIWRNDNL